MITDEFKADIQSLSDNSNSKVVFVDDTSFCLRGGRDPIDLLGYIRVVGTHQQAISFLTLTLSKSNEMLVAFQLETIE